MGHSGKFLVHKSPSTSLSKKQKSFKSPFSKQFELEKCSEREIRTLSNNLKDVLSKYFRGLRLQTPFPVFAQSLHIIFSLMLYLCKRRCV